MRTNQLFTLKIALFESSVSTPSSCVNVTASPPLTAIMLSESSSEYSILGEILECQKIENELTKEQIYVMTIDCNELCFELCINEKDIFGELPLGFELKENNYFAKGNHSLYNSNLSRRCSFFLKIFKRYL